MDTHLLLFLLLAGLMVGFVKAGLPPLGAFVSALMVSVFPPKDAIGMTLLLFLTGDILSARFHWKKANKTELFKMLPAIIVGIITGVLIVNVVDGHLLGLIIGSLIVFLVTLEPFRETITQWAMKHIRWVRIGSGWIAGVATAIGNVSGPMLSLYFLLLKLDKRSLAGTAALFFLIVNLIKVPLYALSGLFNPEYFLDLLLALPCVIIGNIYGKRFIEWIPQQQFIRIIMLFTLLAGSYLIVRYFI